MLFRTLRVDSLAADSEIPDERFAEIGERLITVHFVSDNGCHKSGYGKQLGCIHVEHDREIPS